MIYCFNPNDDIPIMHIETHIGIDPEDGTGVVGADFSRELMELSGLGKKEIEVWINSIGGGVMDAMDIYHAILTSKSKVNTKCTGVAISSAGFIFEAGRKRTMCDYSLLMMHKAFNPDKPEGDASLDLMNESIAIMLSERCDKTKEQIADLMAATTWMTAPEALANRLCDEILKSGDQNVPTLRKGNAKAAYKAAYNWLNSGTEKHETMKLVLNKLNLNPDATEQSVLTAVNKMESDHKNAITDSEDKLKAMKKDLDEMTDKYNKMEDAFKKEKAAKDALDAKNKITDEKAASDKAVDLISNAVNSGKIKKEEAAMKSWVDKAVLDFDGTKLMLDAIPTSKQGINVIKDVLKEGKASSISNAGATAMADLREKFKI